jgi:hypothetical protein
VSWSPPRTAPAVADTRADRLVVVHHDDRETVYEQVTYCPWRDGVTVYRDGVQIARHDDVLTLHTEQLAAV